MFFIIVLLRTLVGLYLWNNKDIIYPYQIDYISLLF
nr:MAG TPA: hypothetical protein [Caudoviricetes sp.]